MITRLTTLFKILFISSIHTFKVLHSYIVVLKRLQNIARVLLIMTIIFVFKEAGNRSKGRFFWPRFGTRKVSAKCVRHFTKYFSVVYVEVLVRKYTYNHTSLIVGVRKICISILIGALLLTVSLAEQLI